MEICYEGVDSSLSARYKDEKSHENAIKDKSQSIVLGIVVFQLIF